MCRIWVFKFIQNCIYLPFLCYLFFTTSRLSSLHADKQTLNDLSSDHSPVLLRLDTIPKLVQPPPGLIRGPKDWKLFQTLLEQMATNQIPSDKCILNQFTRKLKTELQKLRSDRLQNWKQINLESNLQNFSTYKTVSHTLQRDNGSWAKSNEVKVELFTSYLCTVFNLHSDIVGSSQVLHVTNDLNAPLPLSLPPIAFHPKEIAFIIKQLPKKKSPGHDLITPAILRNLPQKSILYATQIYNAVLRTTYFPLLWKLSIIRMIPKPSKPGHLPFSILPFTYYLKLRSYLSERFFRVSENLCFKIFNYY